MIDLRTFTYLDVMQPQFASYLATVSKGYLPVARQASLFVEIAPGIEINRLTDVATDGGSPLLVPVPALPVLLW